MFKLMDKKKITILRWKVYLNYSYEGQRVFRAVPVMRPYPIVVTVARLVFLPNADSEKLACKL